MQAYEQLELEWAKANDLDQAGMVACSSGTAALHLAFEALPIPRNSTVLVPDFTMIACARAVTLAGHTPKFIDCGKNLLMSWPQLFDQETWYDVVLCVHTYGRTEDVAAIGSLGSGRAVLVEDLAEAHGIRPHNTTDAACWSFYRNKIVHGEEGGAVWFKDVAHASKARQLRCLGFTVDHDFVHVPRGHNYRLANLLATPILESIALLDTNLHTRRIIESSYDIHCPPEWKMPHRDVVWVYDLRIPNLTNTLQDLIIQELNMAGIQARHGFKPMTTQPEYQGKQPVGPNALKASREVIYLPVNPNRLQELDPQLPFDIINKVITNHSTL